MSEHPLIKHTLKSAKIMQASDKSALKKTKEILIEVMVIFLAVSITLLVDRWRENQADRHLEKEVLEELTNNIDAKLIELKQDSSGFSLMRQKLGYLLNTGRRKLPLNVESCRIYLEHALNNYYFLNPNNAIFESIKYSGKIGVIRDNQLRADITSLYQENFPGLQILFEEFYFRALNNLKNFVTKNRIVQGSQDNLVELLMTKPELGNLLEELENAYTKLVNWYHDIIRKTSDLLEKLKPWRKDRGRVNQLEADTQLKTMNSKSKPLSR